MTAEPAPGTVIVDREHRAWQRTGHGPIGWRYIANRHDWFAWSVVEQLDPVVVWAPPADVDVSGLDRPGQLDLFGGAA